jgi:hypothetical protein
LTIYWMCQRILSKLCNPMRRKTLINEKAATDPFLTLWYNNYVINNDILKCFKSDNFKPLSSISRLGCSEQDRCFVSVPALVLIRPCLCWYRTEVSTLLLPLMQLFRLLQMPYIPGYSMYIEPRFEVSAYVLRTRATHRSWYNTCVGDASTGCSTLLRTGLMPWTLLLICARRRHTV